MRESREGVDTCVSIPSTIRSLGILLQTAHTHSITSHNNVSFPDNCSLTYLSFPSYLYCSG